MSDNARSINRIVKTAPRRVYGVEAKQRIAKELHGIIVSVPTSKQHTDWHYDLRRKRLQSWGAMLRLLDILIDSNAPRTTVLHVPKLLMWYCMDRLDARDGVATDDNGRAA